MTIDAWITDAPRDRVALRFGNQTISYGEFADQIADRAQTLVARGVGRGDRVAWYGLNHPEVFVLVFACARIGAMCVPLNWRLSDGEIAQVVADAEPTVVIHDDHFAHQAKAFGSVHYSDIAGAPGQAEEGPQGTNEDPLLLVYTSGSTGKPKGVVLTQKAVTANAKMSVEAHELTQDSAVLNALPLFHVGGLNILPMPAFSVGACVVLHERFDPQAMAADLGNVSHAISVPTVLQAVIGTPEWADADLSRLRAISIGSTDVPVELIEAVHGRGVPVVQIYGATETSPFAIYQSVNDAMETVGSIGRAGSACEIRLVTNGADVPNDTPGEIWVKGENILSEYWRNPDMTAAAIQDGWFKTGDVATRDSDGQYYFADRIKHVVISGGENIYPAEIERLLRPIPGVVEVAVVGQPDPKWGEVPVAVVVGDVSEDAVMAPLQGNLARYKHPKRVVFVDALPRNVMGKVVAADVRELIARVSV